MKASNFTGSAPLIGITCDVVYVQPERTINKNVATEDDAAYAAPAPGSCELRGASLEAHKIPRFQVAQTYCNSVMRAGGIPILLPCIPEMIEKYLERCDGFVFTGGPDVDPRPFGQPLHPEAQLMDPLRQRFETELYKALNATRHPVLGICLGMQMMAMCNQGKLQQHLPDELGEEKGALHRKGEHEIKPLVHDQAAVAVTGPIHSSHHQAVSDPGRLRICAQSEDGVIEAIDLGDAQRFYLGVQWHPERTSHGVLGQGVFDRFVQAAALAPTHGR